MNIGLLTVVIFAILLGTIILYYILYFIVDTSFLGVNKAVGKVIKIETDTAGHWKKQKKEQRVYFHFDKLSVFGMVDPDKSFLIGDLVTVYYQASRLSGKTRIITAFKEEAD